MNILIIGGSGFLGYHLTESLLKKSYKVTVLDRKKIYFKNKNFKFVKGDIKNLKLLTKTIKPNDIVYNFAALSNIEESTLKPKETVLTNILPNIDILNLCKRFKIKKFIFASTIYVHSSQGSFYRASKQASELYIEEFSKRYKLNYTILRFGTVYGPRSSKKNGLKKIIFNALTKKKLIYSGTNKAKRRFIHVVDAAHASAEATKKKYDNSNLLITGKKIISIREVLNKVGKILNIKKKHHFKNIRNNGHYDTSPYSYEPKKDKHIYIKSKINIDTGIKELINEKRNN